MGFPILVRWHLYIESGPRACVDSHSVAVSPTFCGSQDDVDLSLSVTGLLDIQLTWALITTKVGNEGTSRPVFRLVGICTASEPETIFNISVKFNEIHMDLWAVTGLFIYIYIFISFWKTKFLLFIPSVMFKYKLTWATIQNILQGNIYHLKTSWWNPE